MENKQSGEKRVIKFRAWQKAHKKMHNKVNLYSLGGDEMNRAQLDNKSFMDTVGYTCEIMQFTGLLDKNGKEIYEGDKIVIDWGDDVTLEAVSYDIKYGYFKYGNNPMCELIDCPGTSFEVIGNIYENPNLLTPQTPTNE